MEKIGHENNKRGLSGGAEPGMKKWVVIPDAENIFTFSPFTIDAKNKRHAEIVAQILAPQEFKVVPAEGTHEETPRPHTIGERLSGDRLR